MIAPAMTTATSMARTVAVSNGTAHAGKAIIAMVSITESGFLPA
jgi:hypothetical protein